MAEVYQECSSCNFFDKGKSKVCTKNQGKIPKSPNDNLCGGYNGFMRVITPSAKIPLANEANPNGPDNGDPKRWASEID
jgi:hypothetical protein